MSKKKDDYRDTLPPFLSRFPKKRQELPAAYRRIYQEHLDRNRRRATPMTSVSGRLEKWMHYKVARDSKNRTMSHRSTLEIGAGTLNHLTYEPETEPYDIVEPCRAFYRGRRELDRIRQVFSDIAEVPDRVRYHRIISIATFEHICDLPSLVAQAGLKLLPAGELRVAIPNEGTILWKMGTWINGIEFNKMTGLNYPVLMAYEHVNTAREIELILRYFFNQVERTVLGINRILALYRFFSCTDLHRRRAADYLACREAPGP